MKTTTKAVNLDTNIFQINTSISGEGWLATAKHVSELAPLDRMIFEECTNNNGAVQKPSSFVPHERHEDTTELYTAMGFNTAQAEWLVEFLPIIDPSYTQHRTIARQLKDGTGGVTWDSLGEIALAFTDDDLNENPPTWGIDDILEHDGAVIDEKHYWTTESGEIKRFSKAEKRASRENKMVNYDTISNETLSVTEVSGRDRVLMDTKITSFGETLSKPQPDGAYVISKEGLHWQADPVVPMTEEAKQAERITEIEPHLVEHDTEHCITASELFITWYCWEDTLDQRFVDTIHRIRTGVASDAFMENAKQAMVSGDAKKRFDLDLKALSFFWKNWKEEMARRDAQLFTPDTFEHQVFSKMRNISDKSNLAKAGAYLYKIKDRISDAQSKAYWRIYWAKIKTLAPEKLKKFKS